ncbi:TPA: hypothetical protein ACX6RM_001680 [Photobacterium damselae]
MVLLASQPIDWVEALAIIKCDRIPLEALKYRLSTVITPPEMFVALQNALDVFYQENKDSHLSFSTYIPVMNLNHYQPPLSNAQRVYLNSWLDKNNVFHAIS